MRFPYFRVAPGYFAPIVPLKIYGRSGWVSFEAYIDSGASFSIFGADRAEILGIDYTKGKRFFLTVGDGDRLEVYLYRLRVELANKIFPAQIGFSEQLGVGFNLLGRRSFFDHFRICFDDLHKHVDLAILTRKTNFKKRATR